MGASTAVTVNAPSPTARASGTAPTVEISVPVPSARATARVTAPAVVITPTMVIGSAVVAVTYIVQPEPGYHLSADHHDLIAHGIDFGVVAVALYVGCKFVTEHTFRL